MKFNHYGLKVHRLILRLKVAFRLKPTESDDWKSRALTESHSTLKSSSWWLECLSCCSRYSWIISSVTCPELKAAYPMAQKCFPQYCLPNCGNSSWIFLEERPFSLLTISLTDIFGGYDTYKCTWSLLTRPLIISTLFASHTWRIISRVRYPTSLVSTLYRYLVIQIRWTLRSWTVCQEVL